MAVRDFFAWIRTRYDGAAAKEAQRDLDDIGKEADSAGDSLGNMGAVGGKALGLLSAGAAATGGGLLKLAENAFNVSRELRFASQATGVAKDDLYQLGQVSALVGEDLRGMQDVLVALQVASSEAQKGNENIALTFRRLGIEVEQLRALDPAELLMRIAAAGASLEDLSVGLQLGDTDASIVKALEDEIAGLDLSATVGVDFDKLDELSKEWNEFVNGLKNKVLTVTVKLIEAGETVDEWFSSLDNKLKDLFGDDQKQPAIDAASAFISELHDKFDLGLNSIYTRFKDKIGSSDDDADETIIGVLGQLKAAGIEITENMVLGIIDLVASMPDATATELTRVVAAHEAAAKLSTTAWETAFAPDLEAAKMALAGVPEFVYRANQAAAALSVQVWEDAYTEIATRARAKIRAQGGFFTTDGRFLPISGEHIGGPTDNQAGLSNYDHYGGTPRNLPELTFDGSSNYGLDIGVNRYRDELEHSADRPRRSRHPDDVL